MTQQVTPVGHDSLFKLTLNIWSWMAKAVSESASAVNKRGRNRDTQKRFRAPKLII